MLIRNTVNPLELTVLSPNFTRIAPACPLPCSSKYPRPISRATSASPLGPAPFSAVMVNELFGESRSTVPSSN
jgi:hypothetical protein